MSSKVKIIYKSGESITLAVEAFKIRHSGGTLTHVEWTDAKPRPLHIGIDDIAAVYEL